jgi:glutamine amidotransferase
LATTGAKVVLTKEPQEIVQSDKVVLPGVGAFGDVMAGLRDRGLIEVLRSVVTHGKPLLGICVGMQVLFEVSDELGDHRGLGFLPGRVRRFDKSKNKVPHTGWNQLALVKDSPLFRGLTGGCYAYFNHSYYCDPAKSEVIICQTEYGIDFASAVQRGALYGVQFHPEKSQAVGLTIIRNFVESC